MKIIYKAKETLQLLKNPRLAYTYALLRKYTMIQAQSYFDNIKLARSVEQIPGAIVECGTWRGGMIAGIARVIGKNRNYYLFDSFEGLPEAEPIDGLEAKQWQEDTTSATYFDNCTASSDDALAAMAIAGISSPSIVKGWFEQTLPLAKFPEGIALLRLDADWYKSTYQIMDTLFPFVNVGGLILIDDYYTWEGCTKAVHDYLSINKRPECISSFGNICYIRKKYS